MPRKYFCYDAALNGVPTLIQLQQVYSEHQCIFKGTDDDKIWDVAPWLFLIEDNVYKAIEMYELASLKQCIVFESDESIDYLCKYFQSYIYRNKVSYFRIWDARVLKRYLLEDQGNETIQFLRPISYIAMLEDNEDYFLKIAINKAKKMIVQKIQTADFWGEMIEEPIETNVSTEINTQPIHRKFFMD